MYVVRKKERDAWSNITFAKEILYGTLDLEVLTSKFDFVSHLSNAWQTSFSLTEIDTYLSAKTDWDFND